MIKKHKKFNRPKHLFDSERIKEENAIVTKYGLKNKKEIWKAKAKLDSIRKQAKRIINDDEEKQKIFISKLNKLGYKVETPTDVLALTEEDVLNRRLQTIVFSKGIATKPKQARQFITHKHILVNGEIVNIPSYHVNVEDEKDIKLKEKKKIKKVEEVKEEVSEGNVSEEKVENIEEVKEGNAEEKTEEVKE